MSKLGEQDLSQELGTAQTMPEVDEAYKATFVRLRTPVLVGCGDERLITEESAQGLIEQGFPMDHAFIRLFGAKYGAANILIIAATAQHGTDYVKRRVGTSFFNVAEEVAGRAKDFGVFMGAHSAVVNEANRVSLSHEGQPKLGCAKLAHLGHINHLSSSDQLAFRVAEHDSAGIFGQASNYFDRLPDATAQASGIYFGTIASSVAIPRGELQRTNTPTMILASDKHQKSEKTAHVYNLMPDMVSDVNEADARGIYYYNSDVTAAAEILKRCFPEHQLDPRILMDVIILDGSATRMALAAHDGPADPQRIKALRYGDGQKALDYLLDLP